MHNFGSHSTSSRRDDKMSSEHPSFTSAQKQVFKRWAKARRRRRDKQEAQRSE